MDLNVVLRLTEVDAGGHSTELSAIKASSAITIIGRSDEADVYFGEEDQTVSRRQFEVSFRGSTPTLKNTGRNPVLYKNGKKQLAPGAQIDLDSGLEVTFRESKLRFDVEVPAIYCLKTRGASGRASFEVESDRKYTVGRSPDCDITLDSSGVSRRHCKIQIDSSEILKVHDLGSVNGVQLFVKGEVQEGSSDIEVPCGVKFIIGDIECILEKEGQGTGKKKLVALPIIGVLLLLIAAVAAWFLLKENKTGKPDEPSSAVVETTPVPVKVTPPVQPPPKSTPTVTQKDTPAQSPTKTKEEVEQERTLSDEAEQRKKELAQISALITDGKSFSEKAEQFVGFIEKTESKSLKILCEQLGDYYSQCSAVEKLMASASAEYEQQIAQTRNSIKQMDFSFASSLSLGTLVDESNKLERSYKSAAALLQQNGIKEMPLSPEKLTAAAVQLFEKADEYGERARSLSFIWTDLVNSSFAAANFDKKEMIASIDALYPEEGLGVDVCLRIEEIVNYRGTMLHAYKGLIDQVGCVLSNYTANGLSEAVVPDRLTMKPLRESLETPLPDYYVEPPPIAIVSSALYGQLEAISSTWTNLEFLTYCGDWKGELEKATNTFAKVNDVLPLIDQLCEQASLKCAADAEEGMAPYREILARLASGEELAFNDANKLIRVYDLCYEYLQHALFCALRQESKNELEAVSADCLNRLFARLKKECDDGAMALNAAEKESCVQNAHRILEILDSAVFLPPEFKSELMDYRKWVEDSGA